MARGIGLPTTNPETGTVSAEGRRVSWSDGDGRDSSPRSRQRQRAAPVVNTPGDAVAGFPRGLPDGDQHKAGAIGRWPSASEIATALKEPWRPGLFLLGRDQHGRYFGHDDDRHILTVAGSRAGKGVSLIVPNLLYWPGSVVAIDPKGELATLTASRRSAVGSEWSQPMDLGNGKVFVLDPYGRVTGPATQFRASFNPLADLDPKTERGLDMAWQIADALIIQSSGDGAHWTQSARTFLRGLLLYVATVEPPRLPHPDAGARLADPGRQRVRGHAGGHERSRRADCPGGWCHVGEAARRAHVGGLDLRTPTQLFWWGSPCAACCRARISAWKTSSPIA